MIDRMIAGYVTADPPKAVYGFGPTLNGLKLGLSSIEYLTTSFGGLVPAFPRLELTSTDLAAFLLAVFLLSFLTVAESLGGLS